MNSVTQTVAILLVTALAAGCAHTPPAASALTVPLHQPLPGLYTAGQPAASDWRAIKADGIRTVINLRTPGELKDRDEAAEVRAAGLRYIEIPVEGATGINASNAQLLHAALLPKHGGGVLVHCASSNRAGALLALEQVTFDGLAADAAPALASKAGMTSLAPRLQQLLQAK
jgi:uncharacterized protein (TIGR01244 family)